MILERAGKETIEYFTNEHGTLFARNSKGVWLRYYGYYQRTWETLSKDQKEELEAKYKRLKLEWNESKQ